MSREKAIATYQIICGSRIYDPGVILIRIDTKMNKDKIIFVGPRKERDVFENVEIGRVCTSTLVVPL